MNFKKIGAIIAGVVVVGGLFTFLFCSEHVKRGHVGVVYNINGNVRPQVINQGWNVISPMEKVVEYSIFTQQGYLSKDKNGKDEDNKSFWVTSNDGQKVNVDLEYTFHFDDKLLPKTYTKYGSEDVDDIKEGFMKGKLISWAGEAASKFSVMEIYSTKKVAVNDALVTHLQKKFAEYGIVIETANFSRTDLDDKTAKAIQERIAVEQTIQKTDLENRLAEKEAQLKLTKANGDSAAKIAAANGEAEANAKLLQNMTPELVQYKSLEVQKAQADAMAKWPLTTYVNGNPNSIVNLPENKK